MTLPISNRTLTTGPGASTGPASPTGTDRLGKQEFLKLLVAQLRNQDPMKPMEDKDFIAQIAQFSSLETLQNLDKRFEEMANAQQLGQAANLVGKRIQATLADGSTLTGPVSEVRLVNGAANYIVDGKTVEPKQIVSIGSQTEPAPPPSSAPQPSGSIVSPSPSSPAPR